MPMAGVDADVDEALLEPMPTAHPQDANAVTEVFRNRSALILWGFFFWFVLGCTAITCVTLRDGPPDGMSGVAVAGVCAVFWLVTAGLAFAAARKPVVVATVGADRVLTVVLRFGLKRERRVFAASGVHGAKLVIGEDSEGSPYFRVRVAAGSGFHVDICEGHSRGECEKTCERFNAAYRPLPAAVDDRSIRG